MTYSMFTMLSAVPFNSTRIRFGSHWFGLVRFGLVQSPWSRNTLKLLNIDYLSILSLFFVTFTLRSRVFCVCVGGEIRNGKA